MQITDRTRYKLWANGSIVAYSPAYSDGSQLKGTKKTLQYSYTSKKLKIQALCCALWRQKRGKVLYFWTVTIPEHIDEKTLAKVWNRYLTLLRNENRIEQYIWVKEYQKNGNLHYHILTDKQVSYANRHIFQKHWEYCLNVYAGVQTVYHNSVRIDTTDNRHIVFSVNRVRFYLSKYVAKDKTVFKAKSYAGSDQLITDVDIDEPDVRYLSEKCCFNKLVTDDFFNIYVLNKGSFQEIFNFFPLPTACLALK